MTKSKSKIAILAVAIMMCVSLVLGFSFNKNTLTAYAESGNLPKIVSVGGNEVSQEDNMVNMPVGIVGESYYAKVVTADENDIVYIKPYAEGTRGCLPQGLVFNPETKEITGTPAESEGGVSRDVQIYCNNEYGSINVRGWLNVYSADKKPTLTGEVPTTAYVGSLYSAMLEVGGYNKSFKATLKGNYPENMEAGRSGVNAYIIFTPTSAMAGQTYNFTLCVDNELGVATKDCTITVANGVVTPEFITKTAPLGETAEKEYGERPVVGKPFEFWLKASGTNTTSNPLEFFANDSNSIPETIQDEYALGGNLYLTKKGKIYSNNVEAVSGNQISCHIGVRNKNSSDNYTSANTTIQYCRIDIVDGYVIDEIIITPAETDVPKGGKRQFTVNIEGVGFELEDLNITWDIWGAQDENTSIDSNGLVTIGINETGYKSGDLIGKLEVVAYINDSTRSYNLAIITLADHIHTTSVVEAVARTCTTDGNFKHYKCTSCDGLFADAGATQNLTEAEVKISAGHEYGDLIPEIPATCSTTGFEEHYECSICHKLFDTTKAEKTNAELTIAIDNTAHSHGEWINEIPATCSATGTKAHKDCTLCHKHFDNANNEITDLTIEKNNNHELESETVWSKDADGHYHKCNRTGCKDNGKVDFASHTKDRDNPTETDPVKCTVCDYIITPALAHTHHLTLVAGVQATCSQNGKKPYYTCDGCEDKFADAEDTQVINEDIETWRIIPMAHKYGEWQAEVPATTESTGTKAHKDCEFCHKHFDAENNELTDAELVIPQLDKEPENTTNKGLNGGAIAGIVIGSVAVAGIGGFAIFWFIIKKKKWTDLVNAIKNLFKKKA